MSYCLLVGVIGISHKVAELSVQEEASYAFVQLALQEGCVLLSTCSRSELYFSAADLCLKREQLKHLLSIPSAYVYEGEACFTHLATVTAGLDSLLVGESDIQGQVKKAYETAAKRGKLSSSMHYMFQKSLKLGKESRAFLQTPSSLERGVERCIQIYTRSHSRFGSGQGGALDLSQAKPTPKQLNLNSSSDAGGLEDDGCRRRQEPNVESERVYLEKQCPLFFLGYSHVNRKLINYFRQERGITAPFTLCTRSPVAAEPFALDQGISLVDFSQLGRWQEFEGVIAATTHEGFLLNFPSEEVKTSWVLDLSMPRVVDPEIGIRSAVKVLNMEDVGNLCKQERNELGFAIERSKQWIKKRVGHYMQLFTYKNRLAISKTHLTQNFSPLG